MADATDKAGADAGKSGASIADLDLKLLFTAGAVGLYATGTILKSVYKAWNGDGQESAAVKATSLDELAETTAQAWVGSVKQQLETRNDADGKE